jgi:hypothetical protein
MSHFISKFIQESNGLEKEKLKDLLETFTVKKEEENPTGYLMEVGGERKFIIAKNVSHAADRVEELFSGKKWRFIHSSSFDIVYE